MFSSNACASGSMPTVLSLRWISQSRGFQAGPPAIWNFVANAGDGRTVEIRLRAEMLKAKTPSFFNSPARRGACARQTIARRCRRAPDRSPGHRRPEFPQETRRNGGADYHFSTNTHLLDANGEGRIGFAFTPEKDRQLRVFADPGEFHPQPEWCENIPHPVEASRGQVPPAMPTAPAGLRFRWPKAASAHARRHGGNQTRRTFGREQPSRESSVRNSPLTTNCFARPNNSSSAGTKAKPSLPVIRGFWIGAAIR